MVYREKKIKWSDMYSHDVIYTLYRDSIMVCIFYACIFIMKVLKENEWFSGIKGMITPWKKREKRTGFT